VTAPDYRTAHNEQGSGLTDDVRERGTEVGDHAKSAVTDVKDSAADRAREVAAEAKGQAQNLVEESRATLAGHANTQVNRLGETLTQLADELHRMASNSEQNGTAGPLVRELADRTQGIAQRIQGREAGDLLGEVRDFARRRPGAFLAGAAGLGFLAGRVGRGLRDAQSDGGTTSQAWSGEPYPAHGYPTGPIGTQQPVGGLGGTAAGTPTVGIENDPSLTAGGAGYGTGYASGTGTGYDTGTGGYGGTGTGTTDYGAGSSGYATAEGDATEVLPPVTGTGTGGGSTRSGGLAEDRPEGDRYGV